MQLLKLMEIYPSGTKPGTTLKWRGNQKAVSEKLKKLLMQGTKFTDEEAKLLDICLMLHAEHGGGNNSTFTTHVVTSSGTDTYSAIAAGMSSLKGPKHGGADAKLCAMMKEIKESVSSKCDYIPLEDR